MHVNDARSCVAWRRAAVLLIGVAAATACSPSISLRHRALSDDWQRSRGAAGSDDAGEPLFEGAEFLERAALVHRVLERNPTLRAARYAWRAALARPPQVSALDDPMLGAGAAPASFGSSRVHEATRFELSQKLPFPGKLRLRGEAALGEAEAAGHDFASVRLQLAVMASLLFDEYALAARSLEINAEHVALLREFQRIATVRYEAGEASQQDPIQAEVELTHALHREILLETAQRIAGEGINALLHRPPAADLPPPPPRTREPGPDPAVPEQAVADALESRPELAAAEARVAAEQARLDLAWREYLPDFTLSGSHNRLWQERDLQPFVGVQLNVPLQLGRRKAAVEEAEARLEQARSQWLAIQDEVRLAAQSGVDRLQESGHVVRLFRDRLLPAARDQVGAARAGFETGRNSFLALIDAERNLRNVELGYEEALADRRRRRAELDRALGRIPGVAWGGE